MIKKYDNSKKNKIFSFLIISFLIITCLLTFHSTKILQGDTTTHTPKGAYAQFTFAWTSTEVVSTESTEDSLINSIIIDAAGNVHIVWDDFTDYAGSGIDQDIFYKRWNASSLSWSSTEVVSTESTDNSHTPFLGVDFEGNVHISWIDATDYAGSGGNDIFYKRWNISTSLWTITEVVSTESTAYSHTPSLAVDTLGNVHIAWHDETDYAGSGTDWDIFYKRWNASTSLWTTTEVVSTESIAGSFEPSLGTDLSGNVHIMWIDTSDYAGSGTDGDIFYKRWNATTSVWTTTEFVSSESIYWTNHAFLAVDSAGNVHLAWNDATDYAGSGTDEDIFYKRWDATLLTWTAAEIISTESTNLSVQPSIIVDVAGSVHITWSDWTDYAGSGTDFDIFYKCWNVSTSTWSTSEVVSTESSEHSGSPSIAIDSIGNVHISWWDLTDYAGAGTDYDIFYKRSDGYIVIPELGSNPPPFYGFLLLSIVILASFGKAFKTSRTRRKIS